MSDTVPMINDHLRGHTSRAAGCTPSASPEVNQRSRQRAQRRHQYSTIKKGIGGLVSVSTGRQHRQGEAARCLALLYGIAGS